MIDRLASAVLATIPRLLWGFTPALMPEIVRRFGPVGAVAWFLPNMRRYERTRRAFGPLRTHLLATAISLRNGCHYCASGHAGAIELIFLRDRDELFPLDERAIADLAGTAPDRLRATLAGALTEAGLAAELPYLDRAFALLDGTRQPADPDDERIAQLIELFAVLNACGIAGQVPPDQVHDQVNRDRAAKRRYARLRAEPV
ncbi:hypothetical protein GCM10023321_51520 [Pseudonocardia eucalypti]|uniref:Carboxymuconolactone decarboxylase-like domain-containing protein n=1 Tax=Pseudonocardia eucalypti TaxID=648755 RepID=A0ABP9QLX9_9PSEU|nr:alkylhydroperoxidase family enzyme [Pseudonocardia eucalypti]